MLILFKVWVIKPIPEVNVMQLWFGGIGTIDSVYNNYAIELSYADYSYKCKLEVRGQKTHLFSR